eukprot:TRINITY_DN235_c0_g1_i10.p1 TRINITY_DN235_c0_g1~~TRINITY_DN235_c0_g1_i10.p1  ORF type:complete len:133 (+),score=19.11 TRINITY_DN235_c0_g1_i10:668-1066(+)
MHFYGDKSNPGPAKKSKKEPTTGQKEHVNPVRVIITNPPPKDTDATIKKRFEPDFEIFDVTIHDDPRTPHAALSLQTAEEAKRFIQWWNDKETTSEAMYAIAAGKEFSRIPQETELINSSIFFYSGTGQRTE